MLFRYSETVNNCTPLRFIRPPLFWLEEEAVLAGRRGCSGQQKRLFRPAEEAVLAGRKGYSAATLAGRSGCSGRRNRPQTIPRVRFFLRGGANVRIAVGQCAHQCARQCAGQCAVNVRVDVRSMCASMCGQCAHQCARLCFPQSCWFCQMIIDTCFQWTTHGPCLSIIGFWNTCPIIGVFV